MENSLTNIQLSHEESDNDINAINERIQELDELVSNLQRDNFSKLEQIQKLKSQHQNVVLQLSAEKARCDDISNNSIKELRFMELKLQNADSLLRKYEQIKRDDYMVRDIHFLSEDFEKTVKECNNLKSQLLRLGDELTIKSQIIIDLSTELHSLQASEEARLKSEAAGHKKFTQEEEYIDKIKKMNVDHIAKLNDMEQNFDYEREALLTRISELERIIQKNDETNRMLRSSKQKKTNSDSSGQKSDQPKSSNSNAVYLQTELMNLRTEQNSLNRRFHETKMQLIDTKAENKDLLSLFRKYIEESEHYINKLLLSFNGYDKIMDAKVKKIEDMDNYLSLLDDYVHMFKVPTSTSDSENKSKRNTRKHDVKTIDTGNQTDFDSNGTFHASSLNIGYRAAVNTIPDSTDTVKQIVDVSNFRIDSSNTTDTANRSQLSSVDNAGVVSVSPDNNKPDKSNSNKFDPSNSKLLLSENKEFSSLSPRSPDGLFNEMIQMTVKTMPEELNLDELLARQRTDSRDHLQHIVDTALEPVSKIYSEFELLLQREEISSQNSFNTTSDFDTSTNLTLNSLNRDVKQPIVDQTKVKSPRKSNAKSKKIRPSSLTERSTKVKSKSSLIDNSDMIQIPNDNKELNVNVHSIVDGALLSAFQIADTSKNEKQNYAVNSNHKLDLNISTSFDNNIESAVVSEEEINNLVSVESNIKDCLVNNISSTSESKSIDINIEDNNYLLNDAVLRLDSDVYLDDGIRSECDTNDPEIIQNLGLLDFDEFHNSYMSSVRNDMVIDVTKVKEQINELLLATSKSVTNLLNDRSRRSKKLKLSSSLAEASPAERAESLLRSITDIMANQVQGSISHVMETKDMFKANRRRQIKRIGSKPMKVQTDSSRISLNNYDSSIQKSTRSISTDVNDLLSFVENVEVSQSTFEVFETVDIPSNTSVDELTDEHKEMSNSVNILPTSSDNCIFVNDESTSSSQDSSLSPLVDSSDVSVPSQINSDSVIAKVSILNIDDTSIMTLSEAVKNNLDSINNMEGVNDKLMQQSAEEFSVLNNTSRVVMNPMKSNSNDLLVISDEFKEIEGCSDFSNENETQNTEKIIKFPPNRAEAKSHHTGDNSSSSFLDSRSSSNVDALNHSIGSNSGDLDYDDGLLTLDNDVTKNNTLSSAFLPKFSARSRQSNQKKEFISVEIQTEMDFTAFLDLFNPNPKMTDRIQSKMTNFLNLTDRSLDSTQLDSFRSSEYMIVDLSDVSTEPKSVKKHTQIVRETGKSSDITTASSPLIVEPPVILTPRSYEFEGISKEELRKVAIHYYSQTLNDQFKFLFLDSKLGTEMIAKLTSIEYHLTCKNYDDSILESMPISNSRISENKVLRQKLLIKALQVDRAVMFNQVTNENSISTLSKYLHYANSLFQRLKSLGFWKRLKLLYDNVTNQPRDFHSQREFTEDENYFLKYLPHLDILSVHIRLLQKTISLSGGWNKAYEDIVTSAQSNCMEDTSFWPEFFRCKVLEVYRNELFEQGKKLKQALFDSENKLIEEKSKGVASVADYVKKATNLQRENDSLNQKLIELSKLLSSHNPEVSRTHSNHTALRSMELADVHTQTYAIENGVISNMLFDSSNQHADDDIIDFNNCYVGYNAARELILSPVVSETLQSTLPFGYKFMRVLDGAIKFNEGISLAIPIELKSNILLRSSIPNDIIYIYRVPSDYPLPDYLHEINESNSVDSEENNSPVFANCEAVRVSEAVVDIDDMFISVMLTVKEFKAFLLPWDIIVVKPFLIHQTINIDGLSCIRFSEVPRIPREYIKVKNLMKIDNGSKGTVYLTDHALDNDDLDDAISIDNLKFIHVDSGIDLPEGFKLTDDISIAQVPPYLHLPPTIQLIEIPNSLKLSSEVIPSYATLLQDSYQNDTYESGCSICPRPSNVEFSLGQEVLFRPPWHSFPISADISPVETSLYPKGLQLGKGQELIQIIPRFDLPSSFRPHPLWKTYNRPVGVSLPPNVYLLEFIGDAFDDAESLPIFVVPIHLRLPVKLPKNVVICEFLKGSGYPLPYGTELSKGVIVVSSNDAVTRNSRVPSLQINEVAVYRTATAFLPEGFEPVSMNHFHGVYFNENIEIVSIPVRFEIPCNIYLQSGAMLSKYTHLSAKTVIHPNVDVLPIPSGMVFPIHTELVRVPPFCPLPHGFAKVNICPLDPFRQGLPSDSMTIKLPTNMVIGKTNQYVKKLTVIDIEHYLLLGCYKEAGGQTFVDYNIMHEMMELLESMTIPEGHIFIKKDKKHVDFLPDELSFVHPSKLNNSIRKVLEISNNNYKKDCIRRGEEIFTAISSPVIIDMVSITPHYELPAGIEVVEGIHIQTTPYWLNLPSFISLVSPFPYSTYTNEITTKTEEELEEIFIKFVNLQFIRESMILLRSEFVNLGKFSDCDVKSENHNRKQFSLPKYTVLVKVRDISSIFSFGSFAPFLHSVSIKNPTSEAKNSNKRNSTVLATSEHFKSGYEFSNWSLPPGHFLIEKSRNSKYQSNILPPELKLGVAEKYHDLLRPIVTPGGDKRSLLSLLPPGIEIVHIRPTYHLPRGISIENVNSITMYNKSTSNSLIPLQFIQPQFAWGQPISSNSIALAYPNHYEHKPMALNNERDGADQVREDNSSSLSLFTLSLSKLVATAKEYNVTPYIAEDLFSYGVYDVDVNSDDAVITYFSCCMTDDRESDKISDIVKLINIFNISAHNNQLPLISNQLMDDIFDYEVVHPWFIPRYEDPVDIKSVHGSLVSSDDTVLKSSMKRTKSGQSSEYRNVIRGFDNTDDIILPQSELQLQLPNDEKKSSLVASRHISFKNNSDFTDRSDGYSPMSNGYTSIHRSKSLFISNDVIYHDDQSDSLKGQSEDVRTDNILKHESTQHVEKLSNDGKSLEETVIELTNQYKLLQSKYDREYQSNMTLYNQIDDLSLKLQEALTINGSVTISNRNLYQNLNKLKIFCDNIGQILVDVLTSLDQFIKNENTIVSSFNDINIISSAIIGSDKSTSDSRVPTSSSSSLISDNFSSSSYLSTVKTRPNLDENDDISVLSDVSYFEQGFFLNKIRAMTDDNSLKSNISNRIYTKVLTNSIPSPKSNNLSSSATKPRKNQFISGKLPSQGSSLSPVKPRHLPPILISQPLLAAEKMRKKGGQIPLESSKSNSLHISSKPLSHELIPSHTTSPQSGQSRPITDSINANDSVHTHAITRGNITNHLEISDKQTADISTSNNLMKKVKKGVKTSKKSSIQENSVFDQIPYESLSKFNEFQTEFPNVSRESNDTVIDSLQAQSSSLRSSESFHLLSQSKLYEIQEYLNKQTAAIVQNPEHSNGADNSSNNSINSFSDAELQTVDLVKPWVEAFFHHIQSIRQNEFERYYQQLSMSNLEINTISKQYQLLQKQFNQFENEVSWKLTNSMTSDDSLSLSSISPETMKTLQNQVVSLEATINTLRSLSFQGIRNDLNERLVNLSKLVKLSTVLNFHVLKYKQKLFLFVQKHFKDQLSESLSVYSSPIKLFSNYDAISIESVMKDDLTSKADLDMNYIQSDKHLVDELIHKSSDLEISEAALAALQDINSDDEDSVLLDGDIHGNLQAFSQTSYGMNKQVQSLHHYRKKLLNIIENYNARRVIVRNELNALLLVVYQDYREYEEFIRNLLPSHFLSRIRRVFPSTSIDTGDHADVGTAALDISEMKSKYLTNKQDVLSIESINAFVPLKQYSTSQDELSTVSDAVKRDETSSNPIANVANFQPKVLRHQSLLNNPSKSMNKSPHHVSLNSADKTKPQQFDGRKFQ